GGPPARPAPAARRVDDAHRRPPPPHSGERLGGVRRRQFQRRHRDQVLPRHRERFPAGGDHAQARRGLHQIGYHLSRRSEQVLAVVHDQQQFLVPPVGKQQRQRLGRGLVPPVPWGHDGVAHQRRVEGLGQFHQPAAAAETAAEFGGGPDRQAGLADPARPDEADQARLGELPPDLRELAAAADEAGCFGGEGGGGPGGPGPDIYIRARPPRPFTRGPRGGAPDPRPPDARGRVPSTQAPGTESVIPPMLTRYLRS